MITLQELYAEILCREELKKAYLTAAKDGKIAEFLKANGCEATKEEIKAFLKEKSGEQISDAELDQVAGGECNENTKAETIISIFTAGVACAFEAISSSNFGYIGQRKSGDGRICN